MRYVRSLNTRSLTRYLYNSVEMAETPAHHAFVILLHAQTRIGIKKEKEIKTYTHGVLENTTIEMYV